MIIINKNKSRLLESCKVSSSWVSDLSASGAEKLSIAMFDFFSEIEKYGYWEDNDAPKSYKQINVVIPSSCSKIDVYNDGGHWGYTYEERPSVIGSLVPQFNKLGIIVSS
jgi:hypothetical protein